MIMDPLIQTCVDFLESVHANNIRVPITDEVRVLLRTCTTEYGGIAVTASLRSYLFLKNEYLHVMIMLIRRYFEDHVTAYVIESENTFSCIADHWRKFKDSLGYILPHMLVSADEKFRGKFRRHRLIGNEKGTLSMELYVDHVMRNRHVLALLEEKSKEHGTMAGDEVEAMKFVYGELKREYRNAENEEICALLEKNIPFEKLIVA